MPSVGMRAFPGRQGLPEVAIGRRFGQFQMPATGVSLRAQKRSSRLAEIVVWRYKTHNETNPFGVRPVRTGSMDDRVMMQGHLAGSQDDIDGIRIIHFDLDLLTPSKKVIRPARFAMGQCSLQVGAWHDAEATVLTGAVKQRDPGRCRWRQMQIRVERILMPGYERRVLRILAKDQRAGNEQIRSEDFFHCVQDGRFCRQTVSP